MKTTRNVSLATLASAVIIFNFSSCKYEEGPKISLRSKKARLVGTWEVKSIGSTNLGSNFGIDIEFEKDGDLVITSTYSYYGYTGTDSQKGSWEWEDGKESVELNIDGGLYEFKILRLTNSEMKWEDEDREEWELEKD